MAALPRFGTKAPSPVTLGAAVDLGKLLTIVGALAPAARLAGLVAGSAIALGLGELVDVEVLGVRARDDLLPLDGLDVTEVVVVHYPHAAVENV